MIQESWIVIRQARFTMDNFACRRCGKQTGELTCHHILPRKDFGSDYLENLISLCSNCHDWVEVHLELEPFLRTRVGIMNSMPNLRYKEVTDWFKKPMAGEKDPGDKADIWLMWVKQGRKGAVELIEKYGAKPAVAKVAVESILVPRMKTVLELELEEIDRIVNDA